MCVACDFWYFDLGVTPRHRVPRQVGKIEGKHLSSENEPVLFSSEQFHKGDLVETVVDERLVEHGEGVISAHEKIATCHARRNALRLLQVVLPARVVVVVHIDSLVLVEDPPIGHIQLAMIVIFKPHMGEQVLLSLRAFPLVVARQQLLHGERDPVPNATHHVISILLRLDLLFQRAVRDRPSRVEEGRDHDRGLVTLQHLPGQIE